LSLDASLETFMSRFYCRKRRRSLTGPPQVKLL
jgi:hypothetical protein